MNERKIWLDGVYDQFSRGKTARCRFSAKIKIATLL